MGLYDNLGDTLFYTRGIVHLYKDMSQNLDLFDTSNFETTHPLYTTKNHRALGKFKSETGSLVPLEFVGLRAKMYSLLVPDDPKECRIRAKGI